MQHPRSEPCIFHPQYTIIWCLFIRSLDASLHLACTCGGPAFLAKFYWGYLTDLWNQPCILFPVSYTMQVDADSHTFLKVKCSSTAGIDMVHQSGRTGVSEAGGYHSFTTAGTWTAQARLTCAAKDQLVVRRKLYVERYFRDKTHDHMVQHQIHTVPYNLYHP